MVGQVIVDPWGLFQVEDNVDVLPAGGAGTVASLDTLLQSFPRGRELLVDACVGMIVDVDRSSTEKGGLCVLIGDGIVPSKGLPHAVNSPDPFCDCEGVDIFVSIECGSLLLVELYDLRSRMSSCHWKKLRCGESSRCVCSSRESGRARGSGYSELDAVRRF